MLASAAILLLLAGPPAGAGDPPNIVLAIADDLDPDHPGFRGSPLARTPHLDRLAAEGAVFPVLLAQPVCRPALATLLAGRWPHQTGILHNLTKEPLAPAGALPARLRERGYAAFCGGKFWEGDPHAYGFTDPEQRDERFARGAGGSQDELFRFLEEHARAGPWFVWWAPSLPHVPHRPPVRFARAFEAAEIPVPEWYRGEREAYVAAERAALAMEAWLDAELGKLLAKLDELGEREETLIVFLADNGWSTALPAKGTPFEKGVRSPLVISAPGHARPRRIDALVDLVDVHATLLDLAGVPVDAGLPGRSLRPWLEGETGPARQLLCGAVYPRAGEGAPAELACALHARDGRWKYVLELADLGPDALTPGGALAENWQPRRGRELLFDLAEDPLELHDRSGVPEEAGRLAALRAGALRWWREAGGGELDLPPGR